MIEGYKALILIALLMLIGLIMGYELLNKRWELNTVKHGCGEYVLNKEDGYVFWQWKEHSRE